MFTIPEKWRGDWPGNVTYSSNRLSSLKRAGNKADITHTLSMLAAHCGHLRSGYFYHTKCWHHSLYSLEIKDEFLRSFSGQNIKSECWNLSVAEAVNCLTSSVLLPLSLSIRTWTPLLAMCCKQGKGLRDQGPSPTLRRSRSFFLNKSLFILL